MAVKRNADAAGFAECSSGSSSKKPMLKLEARSQRASKPKPKSSTGIRSPVRRPSLLAHQHIALQPMLSEMDNLKPSQLNAEAAVPGSLAANAQLLTTEVQPLDMVNNSMSHLVDGGDVKAGSISEPPASFDMLNTGSQARLHERPGDDLQESAMQQVEGVSGPSSSQPSADMPTTTADWRIEDKTSPHTKPNLQQPSQFSAKRKLPTINLEALVRRESRKKYCIKLRQKGTLIWHFRDDSRSWFNIAQTQSDALCKRFGADRIFRHVMTSERQRDQKVQTAVRRRFYRGEESLTGREKRDLYEFRKIITGMFLDLAKSEWEKRSPGICWEEGRPLDKCQCGKIYSPVPDSIKDGTHPFVVTEASVAELAKAWDLTGYLASLEAERTASMKSSNKTSAPQKPTQDVNSLARVFSNQQIRSCSTASKSSQKDVLQMMFKDLEISSLSLKSVQAC